MHPYRAERQAGQGMPEDDLEASQRHEVEERKLGSWTGRSHPRGRSTEKQGIEGMDEERWNGK